MLRTREQGAAALVLALLLGGCNPFDKGNWSFPGSGSGGMFHAAWGGRPADRPMEGAVVNETARRVLGLETAREPLQVEAGNVWPAEETPRATLANPDAALRGVPAWRPNEGRSVRDLPVDERPGGPLVPPRGDAPRADAAPSDLRPAPRRRGVPAPQPLAQPEPALVPSQPVPPAAYAPPRRPEGQTVFTPSGVPLTTTGGTDRVQGFTTPGGGGGIIQRDGGVTTVVPSGGIPQTFPTPR